MDPVDQRYVTTNFEDAILEQEIVITTVGEDLHTPYGNPLRITNTG